MLLENNPKIKHNQLKPNPIKILNSIMMLWKTVEDKRDKKKVREWAEKVGKKIKG